tara:strand:+ start:591 stop:995 length:405 start_codon:yes stop_codon:yes gene_type:complete
MAQQDINIGVANAGNGDTLFDAFTKVQSNFTELYSDDAGDVGSITATAPIEADVSTGDVTISLADDGITNAKMAANSIDSDQYVDGSIDTEHFSLTAAINVNVDQNSGTLKLWSGTQAQYDALTPDASTIYFIV